MTDIRRCVAFMDAAGQILEKTRPEEDSCQPF